MILKRVGSSVHLILAKRNKARKAGPLGVPGGMPPAQENFLISDLRSFLVPFCQIAT